MECIRRCAIALSVLMILLAAASTAAQATWSQNAALNLAIADRPNEQVTPKFGICPDGGCYVAWFDNAFSGYQVWMQHLDANGNELWPHNGIVISSHPQSTSLVDWDVISDSSGHAVVVFTDTRAGDDLDVYAYRISPTGSLEWGPDGITLSANDDFEPMPMVCELTDGNFAFCWPRMPDSGAGSIMIQKVSRDGQALFNPPVEIRGAGSEQPAFSNIVAGDSGSFIVGYVKDIHSFMSPRYLMAQKFSSAGAPLWGSNPITIYDSYSLPIAYQPIIMGDGNGGAVFCWHRSDGSYFMSFIQHVDTDGQERYAHEGIAVTNLTQQYNIDPTLAFDRSTQETFIFWNTRNYSQSRWGIMGQRFDFWGNRMWTDAGITIVPITTIYVGLPRAVPIGGGAEVFYFIEPTGNQLQDQIVGWRLNAAGTSVWGSAATMVSSTLSDKARLPVAMRTDGVTIAIWEDNRSGSIDVYGQTVNPNGTLGINPASIGRDIGRSPMLVQNTPNPFKGSTVIMLPSIAVSGDAEVTIHDAAGRLVRTLRAGAAAGAIRWDGRDQQGLPLPAGTYFYRAASGSIVSEPGKAVLTR